MHRRNNDAFRAFSSIKFIMGPVAFGFMRKVSWFNPTSHYVYAGWMRFFDQYYDFTMFDEARTPVTARHHVKVTYPFGFRYLNNGFNFIGNKRSIFKRIRNTILITGEVSTHDISLLALFRKQTVFYTEFFYTEHERWQRKLLFRMYYSLFTGRPFMVPTRKSEKTLRSITSKVFYFPPLYDGRLGTSTRLGDRTLRMTMIGYVDDWKKNHALVFTVLNELVAEGVDLHLDIIGGFRGHDRSILDTIQFPYTLHGQVDNKRVKTILRKANLHLQPSLIDPIGYACLEAMASGLPVIASRNAGCADYLDGNGILINPRDARDLKRAIRAYSSPASRRKAGLLSRRIVEERHWTGNTSLLESYHSRFEGFLKRSFEA